MTECELPVDVALQVEVFREGSVCCRGTSRSVLASFLRCLVGPLIRGSRWGVLIDALLYFEKKRLLFVIKL